MLNLSDNIKDLREYILYDIHRKGVQEVYLRTQTKKEDVKKVLLRLKAPYRVQIITNDLTITELGFKMVSRQCIGGTYVKEVL